MAEPQNLDRLVAFIESSYGLRLAPWQVDLLHVVLRHDENVPEAVTGANPLCVCGDRLTQHDQTRRERRRCMHRGCGCMNFRLDVSITAAEVCRGDEHVIPHRGCILR